MIRETIVALIVYAGALVASAQAQPQAYVAPPAPYPYHQPAMYYTPAYVWVPGWQTGPFGLVAWRTWVAIPQPQQYQQPLPPPQQQQAPQQ